MLFLPIIDRELRGAARQWRTHYARSLAGGIALALSLYLILLLNDLAAIANPGTEVLLVTSILAMALCLYSGVNRTCDSVSSEKREDTIGLLFLTHLKGYDIILGKLCASSLRAFFLLLSVLPVLSVPVFLGGVSSTELTRVPVVLLTSLFLAVSVGIVVSVFVRSQRAAYLTSGMLITSITILLPLAAFAVQRFSTFPWLAPYLNLPSPAFALQMSFTNTIGLSTNLFWIAIGIQLSIAITAVVTACLAIPHLWTRKSESRWRFKEWFAQLNFGSSEVRTSRRWRMLNRNSIFWLTCRDRFGALGAALFAIGSLLFTTFVIFYYEVSREPAFVIFFGALALNDFAMRIRVASLASLSLGQERQSGALEMILSTPITIREILQGVWRTIRQKLLWTYVPLLIAATISAHLFVQFVGGHYIVAIFFLVMSIADFIAIGYVAMWKGMRLRNVQHAAAAALLRVLIFPWFLWAFLASWRPFQELFREWGEHGALYAAIGIWGISTGRALISARRNLFAHLREAATDRYNFERRTGLRALLSKWDTEFPTFRNFFRGRRSVVLD